MLIYILLVNLIINTCTYACPDLPSLRSEFITSSDFDLNKISGLWYEIASHDLAQVGEKCQTYTKSTFQNATKNHVQGISEEFSFVYIDGRPNTAMTLFYETSDNTSNIGIFERFLDTPITDYLKFPSVIVDVTSSDGGNSYDTITEYLCFKVAGIEYEEIRIGARKPTLAEDQFKSIEDNLISLGLTSKLSFVDHSNCKY